MELIDWSQVARTTQEGTYLVPSSIDCTCPHCKRTVNFTMNVWLMKKTEAHVGKAKCPACQEWPLFVHLGFNDENPKRGELFIHPKSYRRVPIGGVDQIDTFSTALENAYTSAIDSYNERIWPATSVLTRRLLEGIMQTQLPKELHNQPLFRQLQELPNHVQLEEPLLTLADTLRKGGNLGAHFNMEKEPDEEIITMMLNLIDYLIEYIFVLPNRIQELHNALENLGVSSKQNRQTF